MNPAESVQAPAVERSVAIFSSREDVRTLTRSIAACIDAIHGPSAVIDVIVNGNGGLANALCGPLALAAPEGSPPPARRLRVWDVALGDKAHAWNEYIRHLWPNSHLAFFVDGMVRPLPISFESIARGIALHPEAWVASAVPTQGMSARAQRKTMLTEGGGLHGSLYAIRGEVLHRLVAEGFKLPRGIYRNDSLLNAAICFSMDPARHAWNAGRVHVEPQASWRQDTLKWWRPRDLQSHFKRKRRQKQGMLENAAVKQWLAVEKRAPAALPDTAAEMVIDWIQRRPGDAASLLSRHPACQEVLDALSAPRDWSATAIAPVLVGTRAF